MFIDTHTHLYSEQFDDDRHAMLQRMLDAGISKAFLPNIDSTSIEGMLQLEKDYPDICYPMMGLHPCSVNENYEEELARVEAEWAKRPFVAVGEIGIDLYWDKTFFTQQQDAFRRQIQLAKKHKVPIIIHCRESFDEIFEILEEEKGDDLYGIFHCFTGTVEQAHRAIGYNMLLGIGGVVTFKNSGLDKVVAEIDLKHLVLETDSPYLAPTPHRGKRNESSYITLVAQKIAEIHNCPIEKIAEITTANALKVFNING